MCQWSNSKAFREDYEKRILPSLDSRQLCRDGRMRNPNEKPIILEVQQATVPDTTPAKKTINQAKKDPQPIPTRVDTAFNEKVVDKETTSKLVEAPAKIKTTSPEVNVDSHDNEKSRKEPLKASEMDAEKLRELKREEEIAKAKLAEERKKKLAEKSAAKAAARAQKEADKKFKVFVLLHKRIYCTRDSKSFYKGSSTFQFLQLGPLHFIPSVPYSSNFLVKLHEKAHVNFS